MCEVASKKIHLRLVSFTNWYCEKIVVTVLALP